MSLEQDVESRKRRRVEGITAANQIVQGYVDDIERFKVVEKELENKIKELQQQLSTTQNSLEQTSQLQNQRIREVANELESAQQENAKLQQQIQEKQLELQNASKVSTLTQELFDENDQLLSALQTIIVLRNDIKTNEYFESLFLNSIEKMTVQQKLTTIDSTGLKKEKLLQSLQQYLQVAKPEEQDSIQKMINIITDQLQFLSNLKSSQPSTSSNQ